jgi:hypothetical protein
VSRPIDLDKFLTTDPRDVGCGRAMEVLHVYAELVASDADAAQRYPEVAAHVRACGPCLEDLEALLSAIRPSADDDDAQRPEAAS